MIAAARRLCGWLAISSPAFDAAMLEVLGAYGSAATLVVAPPEVYGGRELADFITTHRTTHAFLGPSGRAGALPITKASDRLQVHVTSVTHAIRRLEADGLVERIPHPTDGRTTLVRLTDLGRSTVEDATVTLNTDVFADIGITDEQSRALAESIRALRHSAGDF